MQTHGTIQTLVVLLEEIVLQLCREKSAAAAVRHVRAPSMMHVPTRSPEPMPDITADLVHPPIVPCTIPAAATRISAAAARDLFDLAVRVGDHSSENIPQPIQDLLNSHGWSEFLVPWIWSAADGAASDAIVEWAASAGRGMQDVFTFLQGDLAAPQAFRACWEALRAGLRALGIGSAVDLAAWWVSSGFGFSAARPYTYVSRGAQEYALLCAIDQKQEAGMIRALLPALALHLGRHPELIDETSRAAPPQAPRARGGRNRRNSCSSAVGCIPAGSNHSQVEANGVAVAVNLQQTDPALADQRQVQQRPGFAALPEPEWIDSSVAGPQLCGRERPPLPAPSSNRSVDAGWPAIDHFPLTACLSSPFFHLDSILDNLIEGWAEAVADVYGLLDSAADEEATATCP